MKAVEGERLSLSGVQRSDMGGFLCIASNGIPPSVSRRYDVQVNCKYRIRLKSPRLQRFKAISRFFHAEKKK